MDDQDEKRDEFPAGFEWSQAEGDTDGWLYFKGEQVGGCFISEAYAKKTVHIIMSNIVTPAVEEATRELREELAEKRRQVEVLKEVVEWRDTKRELFGKHPADPARVLRDQVAELHAQLGEIRSAFDELRGLAERRGEAPEDPLAIVDEPAQETLRADLDRQTERADANLEAFKVERAMHQRAMQGRGSVLAGSDQEVERLRAEVDELHSRVQSEAAVRGKLRGRMNRASGEALVLAKEIRGEAPDVRYAERLAMEIHAILEGDGE